MFSRQLTSQFTYSVLVLKGFNRFLDKICDDQTLETHVLAQTHNMIVINSDSNVTALLSSGETLHFFLDRFLQHSICLTEDGNMAMLCLILSLSLSRCLFLPPPFLLLLHQTSWSWQSSGAWGVWREDNYIPSFPSLNAKRWESQTEMKAESCSLPPVSRQILFFAFLCKCLLIQHVHLLVCVCLESVHRSLSDTFCWV